MRIYDLIFILPLATFLIAGLFGNKIPKKLSGLLGTASMGIACIAAFALAYQYFFTSQGIVEGVYQQGQKSKQPLFTSEIETLNAVIIVLRKLDKFFRLLGLDVLHYSLKQELRQVAVEDAA